MPTMLDSDRTSTSGRPSKDASRQTVINIRVHSRQINIIDQAAEILGQSRSAFMLERSVQAAETVLLDQRLFALDDEAYAKFRQVLDQPVVRNERLCALMRKPAPWER